MEFFIERAVPEDYQLIADVIQLVWQQMERKDWFAADDSEYTSRILKEGKGIGYKAFSKDSGELAGVFLVSLPGTGEENLGRDIGFSEDKLGKVAHMESIAIFPEYRGHGLQYAMMQTAEKELKKLDFRYLMCTVHPDNEFSKNNIIRQGYEIVVTKEKYQGHIRDILLKELI